MERVRIEISWWTYDSIKKRAEKYHWSIPFRYGEHSVENHKTMTVCGFIIGETADAYNVLLDYRKGYWTNKAVNGFKALISKRSVVEIKEAG